MRLGLISDSHGDMVNLKKAVLSMGAVEVLLHAGDFYEDSRRIERASGLKVIGVMGNCDHLMTGPVEKVVEAGGKSILLTHGHQYGVKRDKGALRQRAALLGVQVVVFGHTHIAESFWSDGVLFINPGSCRYGRSEHGLSYGILEINECGAMVPTIHSLG